MAKKNGGIFSDPFDFNRDGRLDAAESFMEYMAFREATKDLDDDDGFDDDGFDGDDCDGFNDGDDGFDMTPEGAVSSNCDNTSDIDEDEKLLYLRIPEAVVQKIAEKKASEATGEPPGRALEKDDTDEEEPWGVNLSDDKGKKRREAKEDSGNKKLPRRRRIAAAAVVCVVAVSLYIAGSYFLDLYSAYTNYQKAEQYMEKGKYRSAWLSLALIKDRDYMDTDALSHICSAHIFYEGGRLQEAIELLYGQEYHLDHHTWEQKEKVDAFLDRLVVERNSKNNKIERINTVSSRIRYEDRIENGVPFVGMPESRIADTSLGAPEEKVYHNNETKNGKVYSANIYDFSRYDGKCIFTARCIDGHVTEVWDYRSDPKPPRADISTVVIPDDKDVGDFSHPEDFYDWYYDDFYDYEEAEEYYYSHGGR